MLLLCCARVIYQQFQQGKLLGIERRCVAMGTGNGDAGRQLAGLTVFHMENSDSFPTDADISKGDNGLHTNIVPCVAAIPRQFAGATCEFAARDVAAFHLGRCVAPSPVITPMRTR